MNLEGQNLESLRKMIRHLQEENQELKTLLKKANRCMYQGYVYY